MQMRPLSHQPLLRRAAGLVVLLACAGIIAGAQARLTVAGVGLGAAAMETEVSGAQVRDTQVADETTGSIGPISADGVTLSDEDRFRIYQGVMRMPDAPVASAKPPADTQPLPPEVAMQDLPASVIRQVPQVEGDKFVKFDDRILVVEPTTRQVIAMIPRYKLMQ
jgi:hypothetical protein